MKELVSWFTRAVAVFIEFTKHSNLMKAAVYVLGAVMVAVGAAALAAWAPVLLPFLGIAAAVAAVVLVVDELITLFRGGDTLIGRFIDRTYGAGTAARVVATLRDAFTQTVDAVRSLVSGAANAWTSIQSGASTAADKIRSTFGGATASMLNATRGIGDLFVAQFELASAALGRLADRAMEYLRPVMDAARPFIRLLGGELGTVFRASLPNTRVLGAALDAFTSANNTIAGTSRTVAGGLNSATTAINAPVTVGSIQVNGAANPEATGRAVRRALTAQTTASLQTTRAARPGGRVADEG
jgi:hypothetical protein